MPKDEEVAKRGTLLGMIDDSANIDQHEFRNYLPNYATTQSCIPQDETAVTEEELDMDIQTVDFHIDVLIRMNRQILRVQNRLRLQTVRIVPL